MIYQARPDTPAYRYIKETVEAREAEYGAYVGRVRRATGFAKIENFIGSKPNSSLTGRYQIYAIGVEPAVADGLDPKVWKREFERGGLVYVSPMRRTREGKQIDAALRSCASLPSFWDIHAALKVKKPPTGHFAFTQLFYRNNHAIVYFDDQCRADMQNPDLVEITHAEFDRLVGNE